MGNKTLRKELELDLIRSIEETLNKRNAIAAGKIKKKVEEASKDVAKKFYKAIKLITNEKAAASKSTSKKAVKKPTVSIRTTKAPAKKKK
jgi:hypothetical protein